MTDHDLEQRAHVYWSQIRDPKQLKTRAINSSIAKKASEDVGEQVLLLPQVVAVAYFLGYSEKEFLNLRDFYTACCRAGIVDLFSDGQKINCRKYGQKTYKQLGIRRSDVETVFQQMSDRDELNYNSKRFAEALERL